MSEALFNKKFEVTTQQLGTYDPVKVDFYGLGINLKDGNDVKSEDDHLVTLYLPLWQIMLNYTNNIPVSINKEASFLSICKVTVDIIRSFKERGTMVNVTRERVSVHEYSGLTYAEVKKFYKFLLDNNKYAIADHFAKPATTAFTSHTGNAVGKTPRKTELAVEAVYNETIANETDMTVSEIKPITKKSLRNRFNKNKNKIQGWDNNA